MDMQMILPKDEEGRPRPFMPEEGKCATCVHGRKILIQQVIHQQAGGLVATPNPMRTATVALRHVYGCKMFATLVVEVFVDCEEYSEDEDMTGATD